MQLFQKIFSSLENEKNSLINSILTFFFAVNLRNFIEAFSQHTINYLNIKSDILGWFILHVNLAYLTVALSFILLVYYATRTSILKIAKVILPLFIILLLAPTLDFIFTAGSGVDMMYFMPNKNTSFKNFLLFWGDENGWTLGMRIEIFLSLIGFFCYFLYKKMNPLLSFIYSLCAYAILLFWGSAPIIMTKILAPFDIQITLNGESLVYYFSLVLPLLGLWVSYLASPKIVSAILKDLRWLRVFHFMLMYLFGIVVASQSFYVPHSILLTSTFLLLSILFAILFSIITNNIADQKIDAVSNRNRPLITGVISLFTYQVIGYFSLWAALYYAFLAGTQFLYMILAFISLYFLYSMPPLRLKRILFFSKLTISTNSLILVLMGYFAVANTTHQFPEILAVIFLMGFTVAMNFIDIKDVKGDAAAGIHTLPTVFGEKIAKIMIGLGFLGSYIAFYFFLKKSYMLPFLIAVGIYQFYLINQKKYREWKVLSVYLFSFSMILISLL